MRHPASVARCPAEHGATAAEYALLVSLIALFIFASVTAVGINLNSLYNRSCDDVVGVAGNGNC
jgi:Flp pilus assembly pilin Flp